VLVFCGCFASVVSLASSMSVSCFSYENALERLWLNAVLGYNILLLLIFLVVVDSNLIMPRTQNLVDTFLLVPIVFLPLRQLYHRT